MLNEVIIYGSNWCGYTISALRVLDELEVPYRYVNVDAHPAAEELIATWNHGRSVRPTFQINDKILVNPSHETIEHELRLAGHVPAPLAA